MITLYHGTNTPIDAIDLKQSKRYKDFNRAFYLSANKEQAIDVVYKSKTYEALSRPETGLYSQSSGYVYEYLQQELGI